MATIKQVNKYIELCEQLGIAPDDEYETWGGREMFQKIHDLIQRVEAQVREIDKAPGALEPERGENMPEEYIQALENDRERYEKLIRSEWIDGGQDYTPPDYDPIAVRKALGMIE